MKNEELGCGWVLECEKRGLNPLEATADDILGYMPQIERHNGKRDILLPHEDLVELAEQEPQYTSALASVSGFVAEVSFIAGLSPAETEVVACICDGGYSHGSYAEVIAYRLNTTPAAVRVRWFRARGKLVSEWASPPKPRTKQFLASASEGNGRY